MVRPGGRPRAPCRLTVTMGPAGPLIQRHWSERVVVSLGGVLLTGDGRSVEVARIVTGDGRSVEVARIGRSMNSFGMLVKISHGLAAAEGNAAGERYVITAEHFCG